MSPVVGTYANGTIYFTYAEIWGKPINKRVETLFFAAAGNRGFFGLFRGWRRRGVRQPFHGVLKAYSVQSQINGFWHGSF